MAIKSGLVALVASVQAYFDARGLGTNVSLGWKQPTKQINQGEGRANRVVFIPSDPSGRGGALAGAHQPGPRRFGTGPSTIEARALYTWERSITVSVWAVDPTSPADESLQIEAIETLFEHVVRAVHAFAQVNAQWGEIGWVVSPTELLFGRELRAALSFHHPLFDSEVGKAFPSSSITKVLSHEAG